jgi:manganese efflux pump family protein
MLSLILLGMLAGLDNLQAAAALSLSPMTRERRSLLTIAFVLCEGLTPLLGVFLAQLIRFPLGASFERIAPAIVVGCGVAVLWKAFTDGDAAPIVNSRWTIISLPLSLSLDNLLIGVSAGTLGYSPALAALTIGGISAAMCAAGIAGGSRLGRLMPRHADVVSGMALLVIAASMWIRN